MIIRIIILHWPPNFTVVVLSSFRAQHFYGEYGCKCFRPYPSVWPDVLLIMYTRLKPLQGAVDSGTPVDKKVQMPLTGQQVHLF